MQVLKKCIAFGVSFGFIIAKVCKILQKSIPRGFGLAVLSRQSIKLLYLGNNNTSSMLHLFDGLLSSLLHIFVILKLLKTENGIKWQLNLCNMNREYNLYTAILFGSNTVWREWLGEFRRRKGLFSMMMKIVRRKRLLLTIPSLTMFWHPKWPLSQVKNPGGELQIAFGEGLTLAFVSLNFKFNRFIVAFPVMFLPLKWFAKFLPNY